MPDRRLLFFLLVLRPLAAAVDEGGFVFNGFHNYDVVPDGAAHIEANGVLTLTSSSSENRQVGHAFYPSPLRFRAPFGGGGDGGLSFSATFVFAIVPAVPMAATFGIAMVVCPSRKLPMETGKYMGLFTPMDNGMASNRILAIELSTMMITQFNDFDDNHVSIVVNNMTSLTSSAAAYYTSAGRKQNLSLASGNLMQLWAEYDARALQLTVTIAPLGQPQPVIPLLRSSVDLSSLFLDDMYVGFSATTGKAVTSHYVLGWSFRVDGKAEALELSRLPSLPRPKQRTQLTNHLLIWLPIVLSVSMLAVPAFVGFILLWKKKFAEVREHWELEYGPHRFSYRDLYRATKGFGESEHLGAGGFGEVYRGILPGSKLEVAVKKISHGSRQGMREFISEIVTLGRLRHRNLVQMLGYSRRKGELFLVYDFMPNGSLDKLLFDPVKATLSWAQRIHVVKGVAAGLLYLHEEWEQVVIHRDIKAGNVLLDGELNGRLGDFGLSRLYDHGSGPQTTHVVGTSGYMAPELTRTGRATKATDVYAFGAFLLEVACGRRPVEPRASGQYKRLVNWVLEWWTKGEILTAADPRLEDGYEEREMALVLMLGLHCCNPSPSARPNMRQVVQLLDGDAILPELSLSSKTEEGSYGGLGCSKVFDETTTGTSYSSSMLTDAVFSGGR